MWPENFESTPKPEGAPECTVYYTPELVSKAIAELTAESARSAIEERGYFTLGLGRREFDFVAKLSD